MTRKPLISKGQRSGNKVTSQNGISFTARAKAGGADRFTNIGVKCQKLGPTLICCGNTYSRISSDGHQLPS